LCFWETEEEDDESDIELEEDDNTLMSVLIREAVQAGFSIERLQQAEEELASPSTPAMKVKSKTLLSNKIVEVWAGNMRKKGAPWKGPLPEPRISPSHTLGNVLTVAIQNCLHAGKIMASTVHGSNQDQSSDYSIRSWRKPSPTGNKGHLELCCDVVSIPDFPNLNSISKPSPESHCASSMGRDRDGKQPNL
jgi:DNA-directed RNA polymerase subunit L